MIDGHGISARRLNASNLTRCVISFAVAFGCHTQAAQAAGTLYVGLYGDQKIVTLPVGQLTYPPGPTDFTATISTP